MHYTIPCPTLNPPLAYLCSQQELEEKRLYARAESEQRTKAAQATLDKEAAERAEKNRLAAEAAEKREWGQREHRESEERDRLPFVARAKADTLEAARAAQEKAQSDRAAALATERPEGRPKEVAVPRKRAIIKRERVLAIAPPPGPPVESAANQRVRDECALAAKCSALSALADGLKVVACTTIRITHSICRTL